MNLPQDFKELLALLAENHVEYVIVGGYAMAFYGVPRYTGDIDILINSTPDNIQRLITALNSFGFASLNFSVEDFSNPDQVVQLGYPPLRVDILSAIDGVDWESVYPCREKCVIDGLNVSFIGKTQLVENKKASGRSKDLSDIKSLE
jgi:hypothetical protein